MRLSVRWSHTTHMYKQFVCIHMCEPQSRVPFYIRRMCDVCGRGWTLKFPQKDHLILGSVGGLHCYPRVQPQRQQLMGMDAPLQCFHWRQKIIIIIKKKFTSCMITPGFCLLQVRIYENRIWDLNKIKSNIAFNIHEN